LHLLLAAITTMAAESGPIVAVSGGRVQGAMLPGGGAVFRGIPYARAPVGPLRWREPLSVKPWPGVRAAISFAPACAQTPQFLPELASTSKEDCLYLNV
jgi:para-nitrobenzyl esterase